MRFMRSSSLLILITTLLTSRSYADDLLPPDKPIEVVIDHYIDATLQHEKIQAAQGLMMLPTCEE